MNRKMYNTFKIYRSVLINEGENINLENIGCSWTLDREFAIRHADDINRAVRKDGVIVLKTEVSEDQINWDNTLFAMERRAHEFEVVLNNVKINIEVCDTFDIEHIKEYEEYTTHTGNNTFEDYCNNYDGELTKEDFFVLANSF